MKLKYCIVILIMACLLCGNAFAADTDVADEVSAVDGEDAELNTDIVSDDVLTDDEEPDVEYYFFNASVSEDGIGTFENPYKYLKQDYLKNNSHVFLADGEYEFEPSQDIDETIILANISFIGQSRENTVLYLNYAMFEFDDEDNNIADLTLNYMFCSGELTMDNVNVNSLVLNGGYYAISNSFFMGDESEYGLEYGGAICSLADYLYLNNTYFSDNVAGFGGAIYMNGGYLIIENSTFENNTATNYGGAIYCENTTYIQILDSTFTNNSALTKAGGAIYVIDGGLDYNPYNPCGLYLENTSFTDSQAMFGGAITSLNSTLILYDDSFRNNSAVFGGAVYQFFGLLISDGSEFIENSALYGGALFLDNSTAYVYSDFTGNEALIGGAIYSFKNTNDFENNYNTDSDDEYFTDSLTRTVYDEGNYPLFVYNPTDYEVLPSSYSLVDYNWVSEVKDQMAEGNCWAFTAMAVLESCILKASNTTYDFSEENLKNIMAVYSDYGWEIVTNQGGNMEMAVGYLTGWLGPVDEYDDFYIGTGVLSPLIQSIFHVQNVVYLKRTSYDDNDMIKDAILKYGAVGTSIYWDDFYLNNYSYYCYDDYGEDLNHAVTIVGWDDNYAADNFFTAPEGDGAWIVKNSWGPEWGLDGYFYVSYYDTSLAIGDGTVAYTFLLNDTVKYDKNYQYELGAVEFYNPSENVSYYNIFNIAADEYLVAVSTYFEDTSNFTVEIYVNNILKSSKKGTCNAGYYTIQLNEAVYLNTGDVLKVLFNVKKYDGTYTVPISYKDYSDENGVNHVLFNNFVNMENISFYVSDDENYDLYEFNGIAAIKAFTIVDKESVLDDIDTFSFDYGTPGSITVNYDDASGITAFVVGSDAKVTVEDNVIYIAYIDAGNYTLNVTTVDAYHRSVSKTVNFTVNKLDSALTIMTSYDKETSEVTYGNDYCTPKLGVFTYDTFNWGENGAILAFEKLDNYIAYFNGSKDNVIINSDGYFYLKNLTAGTYTLYVELNDTNRKGSGTFSFEIKKGTTSLTIPEITVDYGKSGTSTAVTDASAIELGYISVIYGDVSDNKDKYKDYISIDGKTVTVLPGLDAGTHIIEFIVNDANWEISQTCEFKVNVVAVDTEFSQVNMVNNNENITVTGNITGSDYANYTGTVSVSINNTDYFTTADIINASFTAQLPITGILPGDYTVILSSLSSSNNFNAPLNYTLDLKAETPQMDDISTEDYHIHDNVSFNIYVYDFKNTTVYINNVEYTGFSSNNIAVNLNDTECGFFTVKVIYNNKEYVLGNYTAREYSFSDLQKLIDESTGSADLEHDYFQDGETLITLPENFTLNGNGHIIDALGKTGIFNVDQNNVTISNLKLTPSNGTAVNADSDNLTLTQITIEDSSGTAVNVSGKNTLLSSMKIANNNGKSIVLSGEDVTVSNVNISNNTGDVISVEGNRSDISDIEITDSSGSAITVKGSGGTIKNVLLLDNEGDSIDADESTQEGIISITTAYLTVSALNITYGESAVITVTAIDKNGDLINKGNVTITLNGQTYSESVTNGSANFTVSALNAGQYFIAAVYDNSTANTTLTVYKKPTSITADPATLYLNVKYSVVLNTAVSNHSITLTVNGKTLTAVTDASGRATFTLTKNILKSVGVKSVTLTFNGDANYIASSGTVKLTVRDKPVITAKSVKKSYKSGANKKIKITLKDKFGKAVTGKVTIKFTGKMAKKLKGKLAKKLKKGYTVKVKKGVVILKLKKNMIKFSKKGKYAFKVTFKKTAYYDGAVKKGVLKIK